MNLICKLLHAGYLDLHGTIQESWVGSPQGGLVSPILANVYLHELDEFIEDLRKREEKGERKAKNPEYARVTRRLRRLRTQGNTRTGEYRMLVKYRRTIPSVLVNDADYIRIKYLRYADDWIIGVYGSKALAQQIKERVKEYLHTHLKLRLNEEKTRVTHARSEEAHFLGTLLSLGAGGEAKIAHITNVWGRRFTRRCTGWQTVMRAPLPKIIQRLRERGICTAEGKPVARGAWTHLDEDQIIRLYSSINRGLQNYYRFVENWAQLTRIQYILQHSLAKTLAQKRKISMRAVFKRYGKDLKVRVAGPEGGEERFVSFYLNHDWAKQRGAFQASSNTTIDQIRMWQRMSTRTKLGKPCCICGKTAESVQIEMRHVRHIRKLSDKREATGFTRILRKLNRKQIPVCEACHRKIHRGEYDGLKLSQLAYLPR